MKKYLFIGLCGLLLLTSCSNKQFPQSGTTIQADRAQQLISKGNSTWIDVRSEAEYKEGHIPGANLIDVLQETSFLEQIRSLDTKGHYVLYCRSGKRSKKAMELMQKNGFKHVLDLEGGFQGWTGPKEK